MVNIDIFRSGFDEIVAIAIVANLRDLPVCGFHFRRSLFYAKLKVTCENPLDTAEQVICIVRFVSVRGLIGSVRNRAFLFLCKRWAG